ncbi:MULTISPECIES: hypothetical protein [unclassified Microbacterium]|uniref:hypothetical protein n=1 Tax=unclassified Microbacterium TaxID=2609290 RepID=UPI00160518F3|nr:MULTISPECIES: hypothetical protein [unclassified Microbacterium]QNA93186.1 hypothetical protein G4G29_14290 [Microbacterium sp. Se63.02b]QYM63392.1 hypothetical protein K1X59_14345 [Microbacterium sp. Se5.02b]
MTDDSESPSPRQRVVRVPGSRRARLTPVPGSDPEPEASSGDESTLTVPPHRPKGPKGPNDDQLLQDVPPHY